MWQATCYIWLLLVSAAASQNVTLRGSVNRTHDVRAQVPWSDDDGADVAAAGAGAAVAAVETRMVAA
jgi:hypothetical protein